MSPAALVIGCWCLAALVAAGAVLIRRRGREILTQSSDYVPGRRGWAVRRDGSAEFNRRE